MRWKQTQTDQVIPVTMPRVARDDVNATCSKQGCGGEATAARPLE
jgi:hypothetical protein